MHTCNTHVHTILYNRSNQSLKLGTLLITRTTGTILLYAHRAIESITLDRAEIHLKVIAHVHVIVTE